MPTPEIEQLIEEGQRFLDAGDKANALALFVRATEADPTSEAAWLGRARATDKVEETLYCFERALEINPNNAPVREEMTFLQVARWRNATHPEIESARVDSNRSRQRTLRLVLIAVGVLAVIAVGVYLFVSGAFNTLLAGPQATTSPIVAVVTYPPTWTSTPLPTATRSPASTATAATTPTSAAVIGRVKESANIRAGPGTYYLILGGLPKDKLITLVGQSADGEFYQFQNPDNNFLAWVFADLIEVTTGDAKTLTVVKAPPYTPLPPRVAVSTSTATSAPPQFLFRLSKQTGSANCGAWYVSGTIWNQGGEALGPGNTRSGIRLRIIANGQTTFVFSGATGRHSSGYWEQSFGPANRAVEGSVTIVDAVGNAISPSIAFQLTATCTGAADVNQMTIDFESLPF